MLWRFCRLWIESDGESGSGVDKMLHNRLFEPFLDCLGLMFLIKFWYLTNKYMTDKELYKLCQEYGAKARKWKNKFIALLPEVAKRGLHKKKGFESIYEFAAKVGGVAYSSVEAVLRLDKKLEDKPKLKQMIEKVGVNKVRVVANLDKKEEELIEKVQTLTKPALELFAKEERGIRPGTEMKILSFHVDEKVELELRKLKGKGETFNDVMKKLLANMPKEKEIRPRKTKPSKSRPTPAQKRREALAKTNGKCSVPGCNKPAEEIHHPKPWAIFHKHDELEPLCKAHHELEHQVDNVIDKKFRAYKMQTALF